jgi:general stress protein 26
MEFTKETILDFISNVGVCVLATGADDRITAREISVVNSGFDIYFNTDKNLTKFKQIQKNHNVALCKKNYQIEGVAEILGHPKDEKLFSSLYKEKHPSSYKKYSHLESEVVIKVKIKRIQIWKYIDNDPYIIIYDVEKNLINKEKYDI